MLWVVPRKDRSLWPAYPALPGLFSSKEVELLRAVSRRALFLGSSRTVFATPVEDFISSRRDREHWTPRLRYAQQSLHGQLVATISPPNRLQFIGFHCIKNSASRKGGEKKRSPPRRRGEPPGLRPPPLSISRL